MLKKVQRSPLARQIQTVFAIASFGLLAFLQLPSKAQEKKSERSLQEQSAQRDQAYVRQLLEKGASDAKVESFLKLSSRFASFNPSGEFHAYALKLIAKEKAALKQTKQTQQSGVRSESAPAVAVAEITPAVVTGSVTAPSNPVGIGNIKASQESNRDSNQDNSTTSNLESNQTAVSSPARSE